MDKRYFEDHPGETQFVRIHIPGETWPDPRDWDFVQVTKVTAWWRIKMPFLVNGGNGDNV